MLLWSDPRAYPRFIKSLYKAVRSRSGSWCAACLCQLGFVSGSRLLRRISPICFLFAVGLYYCFSNLSDARIFIIMYGVTSMYFSAVMVRAAACGVPVSAVMGVTRARAG